MKEFWYIKFCLEKPHSLLQLNFPETSRDILENPIYQSLQLTFLSLA